MAATFLQEVLEPFRAWFLIWSASWAPPPESVKQVRQESSLHKDKTAWECGGKQQFVPGNPDELLFSGVVLNHRFWVLVTNRWKYDCESKIRLFRRNFQKAPWASFQYIYTCMYLACTGAAFGVEYDLTMLTLRIQFFAVLTQWSATLWGNPRPVDSGLWSHDIYTTHCRMASKRDNNRCATRTTAELTVNADC